MATKKSVKTTSEKVSEVELTIFDKMEVYHKFTGLRLDPNCPHDKHFAAGWHDKYISSGLRRKWTMKPQAAIADYKAGIVYKSYNITDQIAERLMKEFPESVDKFINLEK
nr:MAG TPA: hypothetical protein [Caudoviricetes sp.]